MLDLDYVAYKYYALYLLILLTIRIRLFGNELYFQLVIFNLHIIYKNGK